MKLPTIVNITNFQTGEELNSINLFDNLSEKEIFELRDELSNIAKKNLDKYLVCSICNQPIIHAGRPYKNGITHYFKHYQDTKECPIITKNKYSQDELSAIKYNGAKESPRHIELKEFIYNQIVKDKRFKNEAMEKVVRSFQEKRLWRKPDVSSDFKDTKIVFEIQLQTTYLNVIRDREDFYKNEKTYIMWFFDSSNMEKFRFSEKDIFYANKSNAFVINNETMKLSLESNNFVFYCYYQTPYINNLKIEYKWESKLITVDDLKFDNENYKIYYYNLDEKKQILEFKILDEQNNKIYPWLSDFWKECFEYKYLDINKNYLSLFEQNGVEDFKTYTELLRVINSIYSLKKSKIVGFKFSNFLALSNNFLEYYKEFTYIFLWAIKIYGLKEQIIKEDNNKNQKFQQKIERFKNEKYEQNYEYDKLFSILFPELTSKLKL